MKHLFLTLIAACSLCYLFPTAFSLQCYECAQDPNGGCRFENATIMTDCNSGLTKYPRCMYLATPDIELAQSVMVEAINATEQLRGETNVTDCIYALRDGYTFFFVTHPRRLPNFQCVPAQLCGTSVINEQVTGFIQTSCPLPTFNATWKALKGLDRAYPYECCNDDLCNRGPPAKCP